MDDRKLLAMAEDIKKIPILPIPNSESVLPCLPKAAKSSRE